ncbi:hypothetical protein SDC9_101906 [bioreactor metagenome]|uniref:Uncharacterized protein n=1 Tax=bioreactor metagenome TaxID=1076179 RepID=A0A645AS28_9ZZZZ
MARVLLDPGKSGPAEQEAIFAAHTLHKFIVLADVQVREGVGASLGRGTICEARSARPQMLTAIGLETIHAHFGNQVFTLFEPPINGFRIGKISHQPFFEPGRTDTVRGAICFHYTQVVFQPVLLVQLVLALIQVLFWHTVFEGGVLPQDQTSATGM